MIMNGTGTPTSQPRIRTRCEVTGNKIGAGLHYAEADDEGKDQRRRGNVKRFCADQRHDCALDSDHAADESIDQHEQRKLRPVRAQAESDAGADGRLGGRRTHSAAVAMPEFKARS
jgi:hypothetical protein